jgi:glycerophosphoryl diester phosphodiesterase
MPGLDWLTAQPVAHRGLHDAANGVIENTPSAFAAAISCNYAIECDVQLSADGEAMVFHDETLDRLTVAQGALSARNSDELKAIAFKNTDDRMITLSGLCELVAGRVTLVIEIKSHYDGDTRLAARTVEILHGYAGPVAAMSFDPRLVSALRTLAPGLPRGLVAESRRPKDGGQRGAWSYLGEAIRSRPHFLAWSVRDLPSVAPLIGRYVLGLPLLTWTVRSDEQRKTARRYASQMIFEGFRP